MVKSVHGSKTFATAAHQSTD